MATLHPSLKSFLDRYALRLSLPVGAALPLAFAPFGCWPLAVLCPAFLFLSWEGASPKRAAKLGFWFTFGTFAAGTYWLYHSVYTIGKAPAWLTVVVMLSLMSIMGGYTALLGYAQARWLPERGTARWLLGLPAGWLLIEWLRGWLFSGFPWLSLGYSQIDSPLAGWAPVSGVYGLSFIVALSAGACMALIAGDGRVRISAALALMAPWAVAGALWHRSWTAPVSPPVTVAIVQGAIQQDLKWSQEWHDKTLDLYRELAVSHLGAKLILLPEAALPDYSYNLVDYLSGLWREAHARGSSLVMGVLHYDPNTAAYYNGVVALSDGVEWYHKRRLVPFGELLPVPGFVRKWLQLMNLPSESFSAGAADQPALSAAGQKIGVTICYEDSYGAEQLAVLREATLLVNVTNDAWFGDTSAAYQHLEISRMRALEAGRPLLRAANDGISAIIDAQGRVTATLPRFKAAVLTGAVQPRTGLTPYARVGNAPVVALCCLLAAFAIWRRLRSSKKSPT